MCEPWKVLQCGCGAKISTLPFLHEVQVACALCGRCVFWEWVGVLRSDCFLVGSATGDDVVDRLSTFSAGFLKVEWVHYFHVSLLVAVGTVLIIIDA